MTPLNVRTIACVFGVIACTHTHVDRPVDADAIECAALLPSGQRLVCANKQTSGILGVPLNELERFGITIDSVQQCVETYNVPAECIFGVLDGGDIIVPVDVLPHLHGSRAFSHALYMLHSTQLRIWGMCLSTSNHVRFGIFSEMMTSQMMHMTSAISTVEANMQGAIDAVCVRLDDIYGRLAEFERRFDQQNSTIEALTAQLIAAVQLITTSDRPHMHHVRTVVDNVRQDADADIHGAIIALQNDIGMLIADTTDINSNVVHLPK